MTFEDTPNRRYWLLKTEPEDYSWEDLQRDGETVWDGVKAPGALRNMAAMKPHDLAFIYHTGRERSIVGISKIVSAAYPDPDESNHRYLVIRLVAGNPLPRPVTLKEIKDSGLYPDWDLVRLPRLSVVPVSREQWDRILKWSGE